MTHVNRRSLLAAAASLAVAPRAFAAEPKEIALWPGMAPGGENVTVTPVVGPQSITGVIRPTVTIYKPEGAFTKAVLIAPGGGFTQVVMEKEGHEIARWLAKNGIASGVLIYRLPNDGWRDRTEVILQDAQRAMRIVRKETGAKQVGIMGFSSGGTLAAVLDSRGDEKSYPAIDALDGTPARPDFVALGYSNARVPPPPRPLPVRALPDRPLPPGVIRPPMPVARPEPVFRDFAENPAPTFIFHAENDTRVPYTTSQLAYDALKAKGGKVELHLFKTGEHGFALRIPEGADAAAWPQLFLDWLKALPAA
jgi:acetyl esterase/lipase